MEKIFLVVGLGNPGIKYINTKHNVGFEVIDYLTDKFNFSEPKYKFQGELYEGKIDDYKVIFLKPLTYMNLSGDSLKEVVNWYKVEIEDIIVIYDDIDIDMGKIRIKPKGSAGSHNGMKSIMYKLATEDFKRVRIGIGRPPQNWDLANYVLSKFTKQERKVMDEIIVDSGDAVIEIIKSGINNSMNRYNG